MDTLVKNFFIKRLFKIYIYTGLASRDFYTIVGKKRLKYFI